VTCAAPGTLPGKCPRRTVGSVPRHELLAGHERLPARPFTDPERTVADATVMTRMLMGLRREAQAWPSCQKSVEMLKYTPAGCRHWLAVPNALPTPAGPVIQKTGSRLRSGAS